MTIMCLIVGINAFYTDLTLLTLNTPLVMKKASSFRGTYHIGEGLSLPFQIII